MKKGRFSEEQIIGVLKQHEAGPESGGPGSGDRRERSDDLHLKSKYGWMDVNEAQRLKALEDESQQLKQLVADLSLDKDSLETILSSRRVTRSLEAIVERAECRRRFCATTGRN